LRFNSDPFVEECVEITKHNLTFYESKHVVDGYDVSTFNYRLSLYDDFINPIKGKKVNAKELRGITFVFNKDGSVFKRFLALQKFWNLNQVPETMYDKVKDLKVVNVADKVDGSLCQFVELPNGKIVGKTQNSFDNEQTEVINDLYSKNENIQNFVEWCFKKDYVAIFEYVSFMNRIVLEYDEPQLILLRVRNNSTGEYIDLKDLEGVDGIDIAEPDECNSLDYFVNLAKTIEDKEGWVITMVDESGQHVMVKVKGEWYCERHRLAESIERENDIIAMTLDEEIDDILGQMNPEYDKSKIDFINNIVKIVQSYVQERVKEVDDLVAKYDGDRKDFAIRYKKDKNFAMAMQVINGRMSSFDVVKQWLKKQTSKLEQARSFVKRKGFKRK